MEGFFDIIFSDVNISLTILLSILVIYWVFTIFTGLDFELDFDVEVDVDVDTDIDLDAETNLDSGNISLDDVSNAEIKKDHVITNRRKDLKWWQIILVYFNFVGLPFMFTFTFWIFIWWAITVLSTKATGSFDNSLGYLIFLLAIIPSLFLTKFITTPFKNFFKNFSKKGVDSLDLTGRIGALQNDISGNKVGVAKVRIESSPIIVHVKSIDGKDIKADEKVILIEEKKNDKIYLVQKYNKL